MTNKFYTKTATLSVYVVNLAEYDKYNLVEDYTNPNPTEGWVSLPINKEGWEEFLTTIGNPEEYAIHDYENNSGVDGLKIGEYMSIEELNKLGERIENIDTCDVDALNALYEALGHFGDALDCLESENYGFYEDKTIEEVAREHLEKYFDIPPFLEKHINYSGLADDMRAKGYYETSRGVIYTA